MKRTILLLAILLVSPPAQCFAREPQAPPSPSGTSAPRNGTIGKVTDGKSIFVGHYGEAIEFPSGWTADAELRESTEVVYFHRKFHDDFGYKPFKPRPSDYKLENFAPMGLIELVIIPKNAPGGLHSLKALRLAKEKELQQNGVVYKIFDETRGTHWPLGAFHVVTERPYRIVQTYAESPKEFYILTVGGSLEPGDFGLSEDRVLDYRYAAGDVGNSLGKHLRDVHKKTPIGVLFRFEAETPDDLLMPFKLLLQTKDTLGRRKQLELVQPGSTADALILPIIVGALSGAVLFLSFWPGKSARARRVRLLGRSMFLFSYLTGLAGFLVVYIPARFCKAMWSSGEVALLAPVLLIPGISWAAARRLGSAHAKRVLVSTGALAAIWVTLMLSDANFNNTDHPGIMAFDNALILLIVGLIFGIVFAFAFGPFTQEEESR